MGAPRANSQVPHPDYYFNFDPKIIFAYSNDRSDTLTGWGRQEGKTEYGIARAGGDANAPAILKHTAL